MENHIKYPYLPEGKRLFYVSADNEFILAAKELAKNSNDQSTPTGAVIVAGDKIVSSASNKTPLSNSFLKNLHKKHCIRRMFSVPSGEKYWLCPGCAKNSDHAEYRAVNLLPKQYKDRIDLDLYLWGHWWCCKPCWEQMLKAKIRNVYLLEDSEKLFNPKEPNNIIGKQF